MCALFGVLLIRPTIVGAPKDQLDGWMVKFSSRQAMEAAKDILVHERTGKYQSWYVATLCQLKKL